MKIYANKLIKWIKGLFTRNDKIEPINKSNILNKGHSHNSKVLNLYKRKAFKYFNVNNSFEDACLFLIFFTDTPYFTYDINIKIRDSYENKYLYDFMGITTKDLNKISKNKLYKTLKNKTTKDNLDLINNLYANIIAEKWVDTSIASIGRTCYFKGHLIKKLKTLSNYEIYMHFAIQHFLNNTFKKGGGVGTNNELSPKIFNFERLIFNEKNLIDKIQLESINVQDPSEVSWGTLARGAHQAPHSFTAGAPWSALSFYTYDIKFTFRMYFNTETHKKFMESNYRDLNILYDASPNIMIEMIKNI